MREDDTGLGGKAERVGETTDKQGGLAEGSRVELGQGQAGESGVEEITGCVSRQDKAVGVLG